MAIKQILVTLNMNGNEIKDFLVDKVSSFPSGQKPGRLVFYHGALWVYSGSSWDPLKNNHLVNATANDTTPKALKDALTAGSGINIVASPSSGNTKVIISNTITRLINLGDVNWSTPSADTLFGYDKSTKRFKAVNVGSGVEVLNSFGTMTVQVAEAIRNPITEHTISIHGDISADTVYHGMLVYEDEPVMHKSFAWFAGWCRTGQVNCNIFRVNTAGQSGHILTHNVDKNTYQITPGATINLAHGDRLELRTGGIVSGTKDLVITMGIRTQYL